MFKITVLVSAILFFLTGFSFAQGEQDSITITTYYPSPFGVYRTLRLYPNADDPETKTCSGNEIGEMYYHDGTVEEAGIYYCNGSAWVPQAGGGDGTFTISCGWITTGRPPSVGNCTPSDCPAGWNSSAVGCRVLALASTTSGSHSSSAFWPHTWYYERSGGGTVYGSGGAAGECYRNCYK